MIRPATRSVLAALLLLACPCTAVAAQDRAPDVLVQAREALGAKPTPVLTGLAVNATVRRVVPSVNMEISSDVELELFFPDKYRRVESISLGGMTRVVTVGVNGDQMLYDDGGVSAAMGVDLNAPGPQQVQMVKGFKHDLARLLTVWLLTPPDSQTYVFTSAGIAEAPDGKADVLDVKGPDDFNLRLFLDAKTHRLLMATHQTQTIALDQQQMKAMQDDLKKKVLENPQKAGDMVREMMEKLPKKTVTVEMHVSDYRTVAGLSFPHQMTVGTEQGQEEWTISSIKVNPPLKPERFEKKK